MVYGRVIVGGRLADTLPADRYDKDWLARCHLDGLGHIRLRLLCLNPTRVGVPSSSESLAVELGQASVQLFELGPGFWR